MERFFGTLRAKVLSLVFGVVIITSLIITFIVNEQTEQTFYNSYNNSANNLVNHIQLSVSNQYNSIQFHKESVLNIRKKGLKNKTEIVLPILEQYYSKYKKGLLTLSEAQMKAADEISKIRYANNVGYFWINNTEAPFPKMIMHPTIPELNGAIMDNEEFNCALGIGENLFKAFVDVCRANDEGYVDYLWPKPIANGLTEEQPKLSYVTIFKPWNWIIGTGVYIDDIEFEVNLRVDAVIQELNEGFSNLKNTDEAYIFIFNSKRELLVHPFLRGTNMLEITNSISGNSLFEDLVKAFNSGTEYVDYYWIKSTDTINYTYKKRAYVSYFEPLDWYIASSYYFDEISSPIVTLNRKIIMVVGILLILALIVSIFVANSITRPIYELSESVSDIEKKGVPKALKKIVGSSEIVKLSKLLNTMIKSINSSQKALKNSEYRLRHYFDYAPDAIFIVSKKARIYGCNKQAENVLKYTENSLVGKKLYDVIQKRDLNNLKKLVSIIKGEGAFEDELVFSDSTGVEIPTLFSGSLLKTGEIICFLKNIGQIKQYQKELVDSKLKAEESNRLKTAFLANMSHEIRTPMNGVVGFTQMLSDPDLSNEDRIKYSEIISKSSMQLLRVVNDIIDISKIEAGLITIDKEKVQLQEFFAELYDNYRQLAFDQKLELKREIYIKNDETIIGDYTKLRQVMDNLITNALKFTKEGNITIGCNSNNDKITFYVKDTGVGLTKEDQGIIFDRFTQADAHFEANIGGTGLGLSISKAYVELMKGDFFVESELNRGSTFCFSIPIITPD